MNREERRNGSWTLLEVGNQYSEYIFNFTFRFPFTSVFRVVHVLEVLELFRERLMQMTSEVCLLDIAQSSESYYLLSTWKHSSSDSKTYSMFDVIIKGIFE